ncbi:MAG TPA: prepilin-type N-terminal cleavage/methylation domain-containing protein [Candidatus Angelobacter sp.]
MSLARSQNEKSRARSNSAGFSLVEILVVIMVILIIAAIAIPNLVHGKMRANEAAAVASVKTIDTAETLFFDSYPEVGYATNLASLGSNGTTCETTSSSHACIIMDDTLTSGIKSGYIFSIVGNGSTSPISGYSVTASPSSGLNGHCSVSSTESGDVHLFLPGGDPVAPTRSLGSGSSGCEL